MKNALFQQIGRGRSMLICTIMFGVLGTITLIVQMTLLSSIVSNVFLDHASLARVEPLLLLLLGALLIRASLLWGREITAQQCAIRSKSALRKRLFSHLLALGPVASKEQSTGELVATTSEGIERLDAYFGRYLPQIALSVLVPLLIAAVIFPIDWGSAVLLLVTAPVIPLLMMLVGSYAKGHIQRQWLALARMSTHFLDVVQGLPTLKLFGRQEAERQRIAQVSNNFRSKTLKMLRVAFLSGMVLEFMTAFAIALVAVTLGIRLLNGSISFEHAFLVLLLAPEFYSPLRELGVHYHTGMEGKTAAKRIAELLALPQLPHATASDSPSRELTIELTGVTYAYPDSRRKALQDVHLRLPAHTSTALVGRSGAGKSTLANLLLRFIDPQEGSITVNGIAIADLPTEAWREQIALVPQRPYLFYGSLRENICLARPTASDDEVQQAAKLAGISEFIAQLPQGYDTLIGERGARLSAGQAQRIAIARAFLKDAPLLILDEPTSSLDPKSEALIRGAIEQLVQKRTVLVIAHRLNTIVQADQVAVLEDGALVETGRHAELLQSGGPYARLMNAYNTYNKKEVSV